MIYHKPVIYISFTGRLLSGAILSDKRVTIMSPVVPLVDEFRDFFINTSLVS